MIHRKSLALGLLALLALTHLVRAEDKVLYDKKSAYSTIMVTEDARGLRTLWFEKDGAKQSVVKLDDPDYLDLAYARTVPVGLALVAEPKRVLIVGLGGGTIPRFLRKHYPDMAIDVVDIDPDVVDVAKRFFNFREDARMTAFVADGRRFIEERRGLYDMIFLDAFSSDDIPYHLATREFLQAVRRALTPQGVVVGNVWSHDSNPLYYGMVRTYKDVFDEVSVIEAPNLSGNRILLAAPRAMRMSREELARRASQVAKAKKFGVDLEKIVSDGYQDAGKEAARGEVLRDKK